SRSQMARTEAFALRRSRSLFNKSSSGDGEENESARDRQIESSITGADSTWTVAGSVRQVGATPLFLFFFFRKVCNIDQSRHCESLILIRFSSRYRCHLLNSNWGLRVPQR